MCKCKVIFINPKWWKITYTCVLYYAWPHLNKMYICIMPSKGMILLHLTVLKTRKIDYRLYSKYHMCQ